MLRTTTPGKIIARAARKRGWDVTSWTATGANMDLFEDALNDAIKIAYGTHKWPELMRIEERQYVVSWATGTAYVAGNYVYHGEAYWKCLIGNSNTEPGTDVTIWSADVADMPRLIQWAQPWEAFIIDPCGFDLFDFAFESDPRLTPGIRGIAGCGIWMDSIVMPFDSPATVWVKFMPEAPRFSFTEWDDETAYVKGDVRYIVATGKCWMALDASTNVTPGTDETKWMEVGVPEFLAEYLAEYLAAEWCTEQEAKYEKHGRAKQILEEVAARHFEGRGGDGTAARISVA